MPSKRIKIKCPKCKGIFSRHSHSVKKAFRQSGTWRCKACSMELRNKASARPLMSKRKKGECVEIKTKEGWMFEHRYIMEQHLGRRLNINEIVHHINRNRSDNRLENLEAMEHGEHSSLHHKGSKRSLETRKKISRAKKDNYIYEKHPSYKDITFSALRASYLKYSTIAKVCENLGITKKTFYNKLKHFNTTTEKLCQE